MTILEPTLYADGALRLTDHGPRGGGIVLLSTLDGTQLDLPYKHAESGAVMRPWLDSYISSLVRTNRPVCEIIELVAEVYGPLGRLHKTEPVASNSPDWYHH